MRDMEASVFSFYRKNTDLLIPPSHYVVSLAVIFGAQQGNNSSLYNLPQNKWLL